MMNIDIGKLVDRFLAWPLPDSVCSDLCATRRGAPHRSGTTLLSAVEAKQMFEHVLADSLPKWTTEKPTKPGWYWWRLMNGAGVVQFCVCQQIILINGRLVVSECGDLKAFNNTSKQTYEWQGPIEPEA